MNATSEVGRAAYEIIETAPAAVLDEIRELLSATRGQHIPPERMAWMYLRNPDGEAVVWVVRRGRNAPIAGFTAALPRRMAVNGKSFICWNTCDFSIAPGHRTLGVAVKLRKAATCEVARGRVPFLYGHPNARMALVHERAGHVRVGSMLRLAVPIDPRHHLRRKGWPGPLANPVGWLGGLLLQVANPATYRRARRDIELALHTPVRPELFDERFDALSEAAAQMRPVFGIRDARYLRWRYAECPVYSRTWLITAARSGLLVGFAVGVFDPPTCAVKDILWHPDNDDVSGALVAETLRVGRRSRLASVSFTVLEHHPLIDALAATGYRVRPDTGSMYAYAAPQSPLGEVIRDAANWFISVGDRDV